MTDSIHSNDDRPLLQRAIDVAFPIMEADLATPNIVELLSTGDISNERLLAHAFLSAMDRLSQDHKTPKHHRCGWCHAAAGGTDEAWRACELMDDAAIKAHTLSCEHNPLARRVSELEVGLDEALTHNAMAADILEAERIIDKEELDEERDWIAAKRVLLEKGAVLP